VELTEICVVGKQLSCMSGMWNQDPSRGAKHQKSDQIKCSRKNNMQK